MADNFVQKGDVLELIAPADKTTGDGVLVGKLFGVALSTVLSGADLQVKRTGVWTLPKLTTDVVTPGALLYWDDGNDRLTLIASTHKLVGFATIAAGNGVLVVDVVLTGMGIDL